MKLNLMVCLVFASCSITFAQGDFDTQVQNISQQLSGSIKNLGEKKVAVFNFADLQGNITELGRYTAESFSIELVNSGLSVIDRSRLKDLINELKLSDEKLLDPKNIIKLGELAGIDIAITGTTTMLDNSVELSVKALDIRKGIIVAGRRGSFTRTDAINQLFRSQVQGGGAPSAVAHMPSATGSEKSNAFDDANGVKITTMNNADCYDGRIWFGNICFENHLNVDLVLYRLSNSMQPNLIIPQNGKSCPARIPLSNSRSSTPTRPRDFIFYFKTAGDENIMYGSMTVLVESCKTKTIALHGRNLLLLKKP